jgi:hypothetical protein
MNQCVVVMHCPLTSIFLAVPIKICLLNVSDQSNKTWLIVFPHKHKWLFPECAMTIDCGSIHFT